MRVESNWAIRRSPADVLPRLVVIADGFSQPDIAGNAIAAARAGAPWILLRDREASDEVVARAATDISAKLRALSPSLLLSLTENVRVAHDLRLNLHLGARDTPLSEARLALPPPSIIGYSAHSADEVAAAAKEADYLFVSPIFETTHRPGVPAAGLDFLRTCVDLAGDIPVYALGGITHERIPDVLETGAHGVAVLSGIMAAADIAPAVHAYLEALSHTNQ